MRGGIGGSPGGHRDMEEEIHKVGGEIFKKRVRLGSGSRGYKEQAPTQALLQIYVNQKIFGTVRNVC